MCKRVKYEDDSENNSLALNADVNYVPLDLTSDGLQSETADRVSMLESCVPSERSLNTTYNIAAYSDILASGPENSA